MSIVEVHLQHPDVMFTCSKHKVQGKTVAILQMTLNQNNVTFTSSVVVHAIADMVAVAKNHCVMQLQISRMILRKRLPMSAHGT